LSAPDTPKQNPRRTGTIAAQVSLSVLLIALIFCIAHVIVCLLYGESAWATVKNLLPPTAAQPPSESDSLPEPPQEDIAPFPSGQGADIDADALPEWNVGERIGGMRSGVADSDARLLAAPANGRVSDDYFRDALFIGDSVTQGFGWYPQYKDWLHVCAYKGVNPQTILQNYIGQRPDGSEIEMWDEINIQQNVANIYILLGANALLQQSDEAFLKYYSDLLDRLRARFPMVPIYVQSLTPTTLERGQRQPGLARDHLLEINNAVAQMAVSKNLIYVDLWEALADENGYLREDLSGDGLHLRDGSKYRTWLDHLATHTVYSAHNAAFAIADEGVYS